MTPTDYGNTTVGGSWQTLASGTVYVQRHTVGAGLLSEVRTYLRHNVANVPNLAVQLFAEHPSLDRPGTWQATGPQSDHAILATSAGRWVSWPIGVWHDTPTVIWIGIVLAGAASIDIAYDSTGGHSGTYAMSDAASYDVLDYDFSMYAVVLS